MIIRTVVGSLAALALAPALQAFEISQVDMHGFISQGYLLSQDNNYLAPDSSSGTFEYNEAGINFGANVTENLHIGLQFFSRDLGDWSNNELIVDWAFGDYYLMDEFSLRAGRVKIPNGLWQDIQDFDFLRVWAILPTSIYDPSARTFASALNGAQAYGGFDLGAGGSLSYQLSVGDIDLTGSQDLERLFTADPNIDRVDDADVNVAVGLHLDYQTPLEGLRFVANYNLVDEMKFNISGTAYGSMATAPAFPPGASAKITATYEFHRYDILTLGVEYLWDQWSFYGEYSRLFTESTVTSRSILGNSTREENNDSDGFYVGAGYRLDTHWSFGGYFSGYWADVDDRSGDDQTNDYEAWRYDLALSARYDVNQYWLVKAEAHFVNGVAGLGAYNDTGDELEEDWMYFALKTTFNF